MSLAIFGGLSVDHIVHEKLGAKFNLPGGPALYASLGARILDADVSVVTRIPKTDPRFLLLFERAGVSTRYSKEVEHVQGVWILNDSHGRLLVPWAQEGQLELASGGSLPTCSDDEVKEPDAFSTLYSPPLGQFDSVLLSSPEPSFSLNARVRRVGIDPHQTYINSLGSDYYTKFSQVGELVLLPSRLQLGPARHPFQSANSLARKLHATVFARLDVDGISATNGEQSFLVSDRSAPVVDTTGAGDTTAGAIMAALDAGCSMVEAASLAVTVARQLLSGWGTENLFPHAPITKPIHEVRIEQIS